MKVHEAGSEAQKEAARIETLGTRMIPKPAKSAALWGITGAHRLFLKICHSTPSHAGCCCLKWCNISLQLLSKQITSTPCSP